jgi:hypothetical protein
MKCYFFLPQGVSLIIPLYAKAPMQPTLSILQYLVLYPSLILKLDSLLALNINVSALVASTLLLVLLLGKALALGDNQILMCLLRIIIRHVGIACQALIDLDIFGDSRETLIDFSFRDFRNWVRRKWR